MRLTCKTGIGIFLCMLLVSCNRKVPREIQHANVDSTDIHEVSDSIKTTDFAVNYVKKEIYGDTVWIYPYGNQAWFDTLSENKYKVYISVWVDTTDYLIDTVRSTKGNRIVIGYNHYYSLDFWKDEKPWFFLNFNKKEDLHPIIYGTDLWRESNLNIVNNFVFNKKYDNMIVELSINSGDEFNNLYYMVSDTEGKIKYLGTASSWGGGGPDGTPFLTGDCRMYVTCNEVYNFVSGTAINLAEFASIARVMSGKSTATEYIQIHALRNLSYNNFLVVFNRFHNKPRFNALILNTDSLVTGQFGYYGLVEDIDAVLLYEEISGIDKAFIFDMEREVLISVAEDTLPVIEETGLYQMSELTENEELSADFQLLNFGFYGSYEFYLSPNDSAIYYKTGKIN